MYPGPPGAMVQLGSDQIPYEGRPLVYEVDLPTNGYLRPAGVLPAALSEKAQAYWVEWVLQVGDEYYRSPIAALRY